jgi:hypothetical protein
MLNDLDQELDVMEKADPALGKAAGEIADAVQQLNLNDRWWYCKECGAINDGDQRTQCWNCFRVQRKVKNFPWCVMGTEECEACGLEYITWTTPGEPYPLGLCPFYFEHHGEHAYYPPMLPFFYVLEANGYEYDKEQDKVVKVANP